MTEDPIRPHAGNIQARCAIVGERAAQIIRDTYCL